MTLYVAYCHDRHIDPVIEVFTDREAACRFARDFMQSHMAHAEGIKEERVAGHVLFLRYTYESDHAFVRKVKLDHPAP